MWQHLAARNQTLCYTCGSRRVCGHVAKLNKLPWPYIPCVPKLLRMCVCVSPPVSKGSTSATKSFECRGAVNLIPSTAQRRRWLEIVKRERTLSRVPAQ